MTGTTAETVTTGETRHPQVASYVDGRGLRWELRRRVTAYSPEVPVVQADVEPTEPSVRPTWDELDDETAMQRLRPVTLTPDGYEFTLDDEQTLRLVQQVRAARSQVPPEASMMRAPAPDGSDGLDGPDGPDGSHGPHGTGAAELSALSRRVLSEDRFATQTFDGDGRVNMNGSATESPWLYIASMANAGQCTAFKLLNNYTAVTAAHCVHDGSEWRRRKTLQFAAGADQPRAELAAECYSVTVASGWKGDEPEYDFAVIRLREEGTDPGASCEYDAYNVGHFGYQTVDECVVDVRLNLAGYPSEHDPDHLVPPGEWAYPSLFTDYRADGWTACAGIYPESLWFYNDGSNGQSGSPVWTFYEDSGQNKVRAIYRGSVASIFGESNRGRRIDASLVAWMNANAGY